ncbi:MAG: hypothetical protein WC700_16865 [Gemmatimonadaceae bacterium]|jgi:hypothetical protein
MTITRVGQLTAEFRTLTDLALGPGAQSPSIATAQVHTGSYSYMLSSSPTSFGIPNPSPAAAHRFSYWLYHNGFQNDTQFPLLYTASTGNIAYESPAIHIRAHAAAGNLSIIRPAAGTTNVFDTLATVTTPPALLVTGTWIHIGVTHKIAELDGFLTLYVNGIPAITLTGDTRLFGQNSGSNLFAAAATVVYGAGNLDTGAVGWNSTIYLDDMYLDAYVGEADAVVPSRGFLPALVTGAGANAAWTPSAGANYAAVDDNPNDGDTTYVKALAAGLVDTYALSDITVPTDYQIVQAIPTAYAKRLDSGITSQLRMKAWDGANMASGADLTLQMDYTAPVFDVMPLQPDGSAWNQTDFNACEWGIESRGAF